jgi:uncharacterized membrane protein
MVKITPPSYDDKKIIADKVNDTVGSGRFIALQSSFLGLYIIFQSLVPKSIAFDPYPFILLNLLLSFQAAYTGPFILWSQNRAAVRDRQVMTYVKDMVALIKKDIEKDTKLESKMEKEIKALNEKMDLILSSLQQKEEDKK